MRWLRGGSLRHALDRGPWNLGPAFRLLLQVAEALAYAHRQDVVHQGVKPQNILLDGDGNAYLADFGIAADARNGRAVAVVACLRVAGGGAQGSRSTRARTSTVLGLLTSSCSPASGRHWTERCRRCARFAPRCRRRWTRSSRALLAGSERTLRVGRPVRRCGRRGRRGRRAGGRYVHARREPVQGAPGVRRGGYRRLLRTRRARRRARARPRRSSPGRGGWPVRDRKVVGREGRARPGTAQRSAPGIGAVACHRHVPGLVSLPGGCRAALLRVAVERPKDLVRRARPRRAGIFGSSSGSCRRERAVARLVDEFEELLR